jgi:hypothetical protein
MRTPERDARALARHRPGELHLLCIQVACAQIQIHRTLCGYRATRDDVHHPRHCAGSVEHRTAAAHDLDALDGGERDDAPLDTGQVDVVQAAAIHQHRCVLPGGRAEAAHVHGRVRAAIAVEVAGDDAGFQRQQVGKRGGWTPRDLLRGDHRHVHRTLARRVGEAAGSDDGLGGRDLAGASQQGNARRADGGQPVLHCCCLPLGARHRARAGLHGRLPDRHDHALRPPQSLRSRYEAGIRAREI